LNKDIIFYDLEILLAIPNKNGAREEGINYCAGWSDYSNMGISCLCAYNATRELPLVYCADNLREFQVVTDNAAYLIGFNNARFDNRVLAANGITVPEEKTVDLLAEIWKANGLDPDNFEWQTHGGYGLDVVCAANFNEGKSGNGALAPVDWQRGRIGSVISYCIRDVMLTYWLGRRMVETGAIVNPKTGAALKVELPQLVGRWLAKQEV